jgi:hypothetical protein
MPWLFNCIGLLNKTLIHALMFQGDPGRDGFAGIPVSHLLILLAQTATCCVQNDGPRFRLESCMDVFQDQMKCGKC